MRFQDRWAPQLAGRGVAGSLQSNEKNLQGLQKLSYSSRPPPPPGLPRPPDFPGFILFKALVARTGLVYYSPSPKFVDICGESRAFAHADVLFGLKQAKRVIRWELPLLASINISFIRAIEVSHTQLAEMSFGEVLDLPTAVVAVFILFL